MIISDQRSGAKIFFYFTTFEVGTACLEVHLSARRANFDCLKQSYTSDKFLKQSMVYSIQKSILWVGLFYLPLQPIR